MKLNRPAEILLVEDNPADIRLTREAFRESGVGVVLHIVRDGAEALAYLRGEDQHEGARRPDLILLDLNLPNMPGRECLETIKRDNSLKRIPIVALTTSSSFEDVQDIYALHANSYIKKPVDLDTFIGVVESLVRYWFGVVELPPE